MMTTVDGFPVPVSVTGPDKGSVVVVLGAAQRAVAAYDAVCERLHTASLRTIVVGPDPRLTPKSVVGILDALDIQWGVVVGDRAGGDVAWELAATRLDRFTGLVAIDRGHPRVADLTGVIRDAHCPPVEVNTTALVSTPPRGRWRGPVSDTSTPTTASSSCWDGAMRMRQPRNWQPRSCCAPTPSSHPAGAASGPSVGRKYDGRVRCGRHRGEDARY
ncbi:putative alpha/beta hydrolase fold protein [Mycobacterium xenopi 4042]|uniref:Putative alpha/beta hydrolase fold protein n=1 Tax=Mycobacterium xenopi 4042 TaxID=1299334 RepID=X8E7T4_MYCXE|nr:putative alpha/beta hydrolase fold protein [Mycobacterium xenopi 3993]EUA76246.1 putative alpha/beta hydrolase fold protein [Mycobacterium xenopi 4042]